eukprot:5495218-Pyramimonas_sp.AAC.1
MMAPPMMNPMMYPGMMNPMMGMGMGMGMPGMGMMPGMMGGMGGMGDMSGGRRRKSRRCVPGTNRGGLESIFRGNQATYDTRSILRYV